MESTMFNMDEVARILTDRGIQSYVEHTGGGCATIMCGTADKEGYFPVAAGPGTFQHRDFDFSVGYFEDFCIGKEHDEDNYFVLEGVNEMNGVIDAIETFYRKTVK